MQSLTWPPWVNLKGLWIVRVLETFDIRTSDSATKLCRVASRRGSDGPGPYFVCDG
jgi:hypothetical protein